jgi:hypothetical protein
MTSIRTYLTVVGVLLGIAVLAGIVVWYLYQNLDGAQPNSIPTHTEELMESDDREPKATSSVASETNREGDVTIDVNSLTEGQKATLETFGVEGDVTITDAQVRCAEDAIGEKRLSEIVDGAAPSPLEAMKLLPCFKK